MNNPRCADELPDFIEMRLRRAPSPDCADSIVYGSIPVIAFGDPTVARIATVGINPSSMEFLNKGKLLTRESARLKCLDDLGVDELSTAPPEVIVAAYRSCCNYFKGPRYYKGWFDVLAPILQAAGADYLDDSACHLDLVQWATQKKWGSVPAEVQRHLLDEDVPFLCELLRYHQYEMLLLNGRSAMNTVAERLNVKWHHKDSFAFRGRQFQLTFGWYTQHDRETKVIGWSLNPQSHNQGRPVMPMELQPIVDFVAMWGKCSAIPSRAEPDLCSRTLTP